MPPTGEHQTTLYNNSTNFQLQIRSPKKQIYEITSWQHAQQDWTRCSIRFKPLKVTLKKPRALAQWVSASVSSLGSGWHLPLFQMPARSLQFVFGHRWFVPDQGPSFEKGKSWHWCIPNQRSIQCCQPLSHWLNVDQLQLSTVCFGFCYTEIMMCLRSFTPFPNLTACLCPRWPCISLVSEPRADGLSIGSSISSSLWLFIIHVLSSNLLCFVVLKRDRKSVV